MGPSSLAGSTPMARKWARAPARAGASRRPSRARARASPRSARRRAAAHRSCSASVASRVARIRSSASRSRSAGASTVIPPRVSHRRATSSGASPGQAGGGLRGGAERHQLLGVGHLHGPSRQPGDRPLPDGAPSTAPDEQDGRVRVEPRPLLAEPVDRLDQRRRRALVGGEQDLLARRRVAQPRHHPRRARQVRRPLAVEVREDHHRGPVGRGLAVEAEPARPRGRPRASRSAWPPAGGSGRWRRRTPRPCRSGPPPAAPSPRRRSRRCPGSPPARPAGRRARARRPCCRPCRGPRRRLRGGRARGRRAADLARGLARAEHVRQQRRDPAR